MTRSCNDTPKRQLTIHEFCKATAVAASSTATAVAAFSKATAVAAVSKATAAAVGNPRSCGGSAVSPQLR